MSTTIDERVVEMRFDNKQFEDGVATSILDDMGAGSSCLFLDGNYARFHAKTQQWKLI